MASESMATGVILKKAFKATLDHLKESNLIPKDVSFSKQQEKAMKSIISGKDTLVLLPTGAGKSWIYQFLPLVINQIRLLDSSIDIPDEPVIPVVSPLNALIDDQLKSCEKYGIPAVKLDESIVSDIASCKYSLVFGSPESLLNNKCYHDILVSRTFCRNCLVIAVDEVHKVTW